MVGPNPEPSLDDPEMVTYQQGHLAIVMHRDAYEYAFGEAATPNPTQCDLDALAARITRVCVLEGPMHQGRTVGGKVLLDLDEPRAIDDLRRCLRIVEDPRSFRHCECPGGPTMELYGGLELIAVIGLHHGEAIRWSHWSQDAQLEDGKQLTRWLQSNGVRGAELEAIYQRRNELTPRRTKGSEQGPRGQELAGRAEREARAGDLAAAAQTCEEMIRLAPEEPQGYAYRARIFHLMGRLPEALADCTQAIARGLRDAHIYFIRALAEQDAGQIEHACADCSMAVHLDPEHAAALDLRGFIHFSRGQTREALADLGRAIRAAPGWTNPYWHRISVYKATNHFDGIIADCTKIVQILQAALAEQPPDPTAAADWADLSQPRSFLTAIYVERALAQEASGRIDEARKDFEEAVRIFPEALSVLSARGWFRMRQQETGGAYEDFTQVIRLAPENDKGYLQRGTAYFGNREYANAIADFTEAIGRNTENPSAYSLRGQAYALDGKYEQALADGNQAIQLAPDRPESYWARVRSCDRLGRYEEELADLETMLKLDPDDVATCNMLSWVLATCPDARLRNGPRAIELARHGCGKTGWKDAHIMDTLAAAYAEVGQFEEACAYEERSIKLLPEGKDKKRYQARLATYRSGQPHRCVAGDPEMS